jgi:curli biogenesis system outer membrane secretion channel CsgG
MAWLSSVLATGGEVQASPNFQDADVIVTGKVTSLEDGEALPGVNISIVFGCPLMFIKSL